MSEIHYLPKGGKISLVAPSFGCATEPYKTRLRIAIKNLKSFGYKVSVGPNCRIQKVNTRSNKPRLCAKEFMDAYKSNSDCIISVGGGETMCEILPFIKFDELKKLPHKFFMGFSDNTNLTYTLTTICEIKTIYGVCAPTFAYKLEYDSLDALNLLTGKVKETKGYPVFQRYPNVDVDPIKEPLAPCNFSEPKIIRLNPKNIDLDLTGILIGGCIDCLLNLCGTKFDKTKEYLERHKEDGFIWFLESCDLNSIDIERALFQLKMAGWFKYTKGFIFGRPMHYKEKMFNEDHYRAIRNIINPMKLPYVVDIDLGHLPPTMPIVTGAKAHVTTKNGNIFVKYLDL